MQASEQSYGHAAAAAAQSAPKPPSLLPNLENVPRRARSKRVLSLSLPRTSEQSGYGSSLLVRNYEAECSTLAPSTSADALNGSSSPAPAANQNVDQTPPPPDNQKPDCSTTYDAGSLCITSEPSGRRVVSRHGRVRQKAGKCVEIRSVSPFRFEALKYL